MQITLDKILEATSFIRSKIPEVPDTVVILGSGLGKLADEIRDPIEILYADIPNFKESKVQGHDNKLIYGTIYNKPVLIMKGRFHYYEGYTMQECAFPIRVFALLGISNLIVSNAAGGINKTFKVGDLMLITDHINMSYDSPLIGDNIVQLGPRFPSMTNAYPIAFREIAKLAAKNLEKLSKEVAKNDIEASKKLKVDLKEGVYAFMPGPQYETTAEVKMLALLGADAVGMSTVPEVIAAVHSDMNVLGISCITDETGSGKEISHEEVIKAATASETKFVRLVMEIIKIL